MWSSVLISVLVKDRIESPFVSSQCRICDVSVDDQFDDLRGV